jgi:putative addiction module component (TIGR02574 family)
MSQALPLPPPGFDALSVDEQIDYVQSLWDHIAARPEDVPVPDWHREILAERLAAHRADKNQGKNWEEFEKDLTTELTNGQANEATHLRPPGGAKRQISGLLSIERVLLSQPW